MQTTRVPRIAAIGLASWDRFLVIESYPRPGDYRVVHHELESPGGTTTNTAVALSRLGAKVSLGAMIGDDAEGESLREALAQESGIDLTWLAVRTGERTDASTIIVSHDPPDRTILWHRGANLVRRDRLDLMAIFTHDLVLFDVADHELRRWVSDLPAHIAPRTRLLGTLTYLVDQGKPVADDAFEVAMRFDAITGNEREVQALTGTHDLDSATRAVQQAMPGANLRTWIISRGADGCRICTRNDVWDIPAFETIAVDPTGAGDAFAAGIAYGMALRWDWQRTGQLANALGACAIRSLGAQTSLPSNEAARAMLQMNEIRPPHADLP